MNKLLKITKAMENVDSPSYQVIKAEAIRKSKFVNKEVSLANHLPALCTYFDMINQRDYFTGYEQREFNDLISRYFGAVLEQEMTAAGLRWR